MNHLIKLPIERNRYFPRDTYEIFRACKISENFFYFFNMSDIIEQNGQLSKIRINQEIKKFKWNADLIKSLEQRKITVLKNSGLKIKYFSAKLCWRMIIGLGASHPQETSMTLHHIYGVPYIPGSAVKGVTRHWAVLIFADIWAKSNNMKIQEAIEKVSEKLDNGDEKVYFSIDDINLDGVTFKNLIEIFGTQKQKGKIIFFDAFPIAEIKLEIDIINPHYPNYYSENSPPADWQSPKPIKFLTVERTMFSFYLASKREDQGLLNIAERLLKEALKNYGIGAKTSLGYGVFAV